MEWKNVTRRDEMQAIIMAAGKGSRLGKLTEGYPKAFAKINGKTLIEYNLCLLQKRGIKNIIIVTGYQCEAFERLVKEQEAIQLVYNPFYEMSNVLTSFFMGMDRLQDDFIYLHADTLCEPLIYEKLFLFNADILLPVDYKVCDDEAMKVRSKRGKVFQITKQMSVEDADGEFIGIAAFRKEVIPALKSKVKQLLKEKEFDAYFEKAIQRLIDEEDFDIKAIPTEGAFWAEIDFREDYERAKENIPNSLISIFE